MAPLTSAAVCWATRARNDRLASSRERPARPASTIVPTGGPPTSPGSGSTMASVGGVSQPPDGRPANRSATSDTVTGWPLRSTSLAGPSAGPGGGGAGGGAGRATGGQRGFDPVWPAQVDRGERDVGGRPGQRVGHQPGRLVGAAGPARQRSQVLQSAQPPLADDPFGGVADRGEHAPDQARVVVQRAVGVGPVGLFPVA